MSSSRSTSSRRGFLSVAGLALGLGWFAYGEHWMLSVVGITPSSNRPAEVEARVVTQFNTARQSRGWKALKVDDELHDWLLNRAQSGASTNLDAMSQALRQDFPRYVRLAACRLEGSSSHELVQRAASWNDQSDQSFTHAAVLTRALPMNLGLDCIVVVGRRLDDFNPSALSGSRDAVFMTCPLCHKSAACEIPHLTRSVTLQCPSCHRPYVMMAVDSSGRYHHAHEYLTGYAPPAHFPKGISRLNEMMLIWNAVVHQIRYLPDSADGNESNDAWQTAPETQRLGSGDCEDSAILLGDWLLARGFDARVVVGHYAERGGHAWVVVNLDGAGYLLETTNPDINTAEPPRLEDVGSRYVPETAFDRSGFFARANPSAPWDGDYWSDAKWLHVVPEPAPAVARADR